MTKGKKTILQGGVQYALVDDDGNVSKSYSISAGIDYPGCGPELCYMKETGNAEFYPITDNEAITGGAICSPVTAKKYYAATEIWGRSLKVP